MMVLLDLRRFILLMVAVIFVLNNALQVSAATASGRNLQDLSTWATKNGVLIHDNLQWKEYDSENWGLELKGPVEKGTILLKVPRSLVLDAEVIRNGLMEQHGGVIISKMTTILGNFAMHLDGFWIFYKLLQLSNTKNNNHNWSPWIESMPTKFLKFSIEEIECLPLYAKHVANYHEEKFQAFCQAAKELFGEDEELDIDQARWAFCAVNSRFWKAVDVVASNDGDDEAMSTSSSETSELVPVGDMFNHREPPNVAVTHTDGYINFIYKGDKKDCGKDLFITYGQASNPHRFLSTFGFVPDENDMPEIWSHIAYPNNPFVEDLPNMVFRVRDGHVPKFVWDAVLFSLLQPKDTTTKVEYTKEQHTKYKKYTLPILKTHVSNQIQELGELRKKIDAITEGENIPLIRRHNELLTTAFTRVQDHLEKGELEV